MRELTPPDRGLPPAGAPTPAPPSGRLTRFFALLAALGLGATAVCAAGWYLAAHRRIAAADLAPDERRGLVEELLEVSPEGVYEPALSAPAIGYTLRRGAEIDAWGDRFTANELGFRGPPAAKEPGTLRLLFVGDSWTYGMGVRREETFAERTAALAGAHAGLDRPVEAWTLALPGYNTFNQLAALAEYLDLLAPDAVVLCPTINDADSGHRVLPNGSLTRAGATGDAWGSPFPVFFHHRLVASHRFRARWRTALGAVAAMERRLAERRVPLLLFFTGTWTDERVPPAWTAEAGIGAPLIVTPRRLTGPDWRNPPPVDHPNPAAHRLYGRMIYRGLAAILGWPELAPDATAASGGTGDGELPEVSRAELELADSVPVLRPDGTQTALAAARTAERTATAAVPESYLPAAAPAHQCVTRMDCAGGDFARHAAVLVRRRPGAERLVVAVRRLPALAWTYPLGLTVEVPSAGGGTRVTTEVPADGAPVLRIGLPLPADVAPGEALDVILTADRSGAIATPDGVISRSLAVVSIEQEGG